MLMTYSFIWQKTAVIGINIRDILSVRDISATKPPIVGKRIPTLTLRDNIGHAARLMSFYRLRALPVIRLCYT